MSDKYYRVSADIGGTLLILCSMIWNQVNIDRKLYHPEKFI